MLEPTLQHSDHTTAEVMSQLLTRLETTRLRRRYLVRNVGNIGSAKPSAFPFQLRSGKRGSVLITFLGASI